MGRCMSEDHPRGRFLLTEGQEAGFGRCQCAAGMQSDGGVTVVVTVVVVEGVTVVVTVVVVVVPVACRARRSEAVFPTSEASSASRASALDTDRSCSRGSASM